jgi:Uma2 family endonuclease
MSGPDAHQELVNGEIIEMAPPGWNHGRLVSLIAHRIEEHVKKHGGGEVAAGDVGVVLNLSYDPERVRGADVAFLSAERIAQRKPTEKFYSGAPDLAVEVVSPSESSANLQQKVRDYLEAGARLVWVIAPQAKTATVYRTDGTARFLKECDSLEGQDVLPGLTIPLEELFK